MLLRARFEFEFGGTIAPHFYFPRERIGRDRRLLEGFAPAADFHSAHHARAIFNTVRHHCCFSRGGICHILFWFSDSVYSNDRRRRRICTYFCLRSVSGNAYRNLLVDRGAPPNSISAPRRNRGRRIPYSVWCFWAPFSASVWANRLRDL